VVSVKYSQSLACVAFDCTASRPQRCCCCCCCRGYNSPADISMKMDQLLTDMPSIRLTSFAEGLAAIFPRK
jgi:hypothetical protein